jgi:hypothetical protein
MSLQRAQSKEVVVVMAEDKYCFGHPLDMHLSGACIALYKARYSLDIITLFAKLADTNKYFPKIT